MNRFRQRQLEPLKRAVNVALIATLMSCSVIGCKKGPSYEDDFTSMVGVLAEGGLTYGEVERVQKSLDDGAVAHKDFLIGQLGSSDENRRAAALYELQFVKDPKVYEAVRPLAQAGHDVMTRMSAVECLGHLGDVESLPLIKSVVSGPYVSLSGPAVSAYYRIDPKNAIPAFKKRLAEPDGGKSGRAFIPKIYMAANILDSDPVKESKYVLNLLASMKNNGGEMGAKIARAAQAHERPTGITQP